jgi:ABC-type phosphate/phosphonate transport system substrate-binding protein
VTGGGEQPAGKAAPVMPISRLKGPGFIHFKKGGINTMKNIIARLFFFGAVLGLFLPGIARAEQFRIAIMQDQGGVAQKYKPLLDYLATKEIEASLVSARDYPSAASMFSKGEVDAMFSGSGVAGAMIIKDLATPLVRPVSKDGFSTYWAVVIAPKGSPKFSGSIDYFKGKKVLLTALASSGEFYFRSLAGADRSNATLLKAASHGAAIDALDHKGQADFAIVKNRVWDKLKDKYPNLMLVGQDKGENPDNTLIVSKKVSPRLAEKVSVALLAVNEDTSPEAMAVKSSMEIQGFLKTTPKDFEHTMSLLKKAGVTRAFNFTY